MLGFRRKRFVACEPMIGLIDGRNVRFAPRRRALHGEMLVHVNGIAQRYGLENDYVTDGQSVLLTRAPTKLESVSVTYWTREAE